MPVINDLPKTVPFSLVQDMLRMIGFTDLTDIIDCQVGVDGVSVRVYDRHPETGKRYLPHPDADEPAINYIYIPINRDA